MTIRTRLFAWQFPTSKLQDLQKTPDLPDSQVLEDLEDLQDRTSGTDSTINTVWSAGNQIKNLPLRIFICLFVCLCALVLFIKPGLLLLSASLFFSGAILIISLLRLLATALLITPLLITRLKSKSTHIQEPAALPLPDALNGWPHYTVLVPLHQEAHMVEPLMSALSQIDYPIDRLQILMITEAADKATVNAVNDNLKAPFHNIVVPFSAPQTKPKALNVAMKYARGDVITIYDAEDIPHPGQLKAAVRAFMTDIRLGAVQAPLEYFNSDQNWLTRQFALEYAALFHVWNPLLDRLNLPFPLGGTSNHIRRDALQQVDLWDSYNMTEDADLTFRLSAYGWKIGTISPPTQEEAVSEFKNWQHQRVRWIKGYIQTWQVHMRAVRGYGWPRMLSLHITLGFTLLSAFLHVPAMVVISLLYSASLLGLFEYQLGAPYLYILILGYGSALICGVSGAICAGRPKLLISVPAMPFYWLCLFWPALRAVAQLFTAPFYWNKTRHGDAPLKGDVSLKGDAPLK